MSKIHYYDRIHLRSLSALESTDESELHIQIVPAYEADAAAGKISAEAPVGRAVLHRHLGDTVNVRTQGQIIPMRIMTVEKHTAVV